MSYILAFDQGTTSSRSIVFDRNGETVAVGQKELRQIYPQPGWVEHDPAEIWSDQLLTAETAIGAIDNGDIAAVGITNQRETAIIWDRQTGEPVYNAIVWQDRRTSAFCDRVRERHGSLIREKTGLEVDAYFSASKINWILENVEGVRERAKRGELAFGTVDSWLVWKLTGGRRHITDVSNASRTLVFNINTLCWDEELLDIFEIPVQILPEVLSSSENYGVIEGAGPLNGVMLGGIAGEQQAALFGQRCFEKGLAKNTYGTGCFMLQNIGARPLPSENRLLTTIAWKIGDETSYALEGSVFIGGAVVQWLRDSLGIINASADVEVLAASVVDNGGVYFVPAFVGLGSPYWDQDARGMIIGLTRGTGREHIARAALESIAYQTADLVEAMNADGDGRLDELRVDGGATGNDLLMQFQADILQIPVMRSATAETTALGAAYLAGLASGFWGSTKELNDHWKAGTVFEPKMPAAKAAELRERWHEAVRRSQKWNDGSK